MRRIVTIALLLSLLTPMTAQAASPNRFDTRRYANEYQDLKQAFGYDEAALWQHFVTFGIDEGRQVFIQGLGDGLDRGNFDTRRYANEYQDLKQAFGYDEAALWQHFVMFGISEGRQAFARVPDKPETELSEPTDEVVTDIGEPPLEERTELGEPPLPPSIGEPPL